MLPPFYYKGVTDDGVYASYSEVVQRLGDARLRIVLYHIPQMSAQPISHALIERLRAAYPATFVGIKDSSGDFANMTAMVERFPGFAVLAGADPLLLPLLRKGGAGCITATSNLVARDLAYVYKHFRDSDDDAALAAAQARIVKARELVSRFPQMASLKALVAERTGHAGWQRLRPPLESLPAAQVKELLADAGASAAVTPSAAWVTRRSDVRIHPGYRLVDWLISSATITSSIPAGDQEPYVVDWRGRYHGRAVAVVKPGSTDEVAAVVEYCAERRLRDRPARRQHRHVRRRHAG